MENKVNLGLQESSKTRTSIFMIDHIKDGFKMSPIEYPKTRPQLRKAYDADECKFYLQPVGETNFYKQIQEALPTVLLQNVIDRANRNGEDLSQFASTVGRFIDVTDIPTDLASALRIQIQADNAWQALSSEMRSKFGDNKYAFFNYVSQQQVQAQRDMAKGQAPSFTAPITPQPAAQPNQPAPAAQPAAQSNQPAQGGSN